MKLLLDEELQTTKGCWEGKGPSFPGRKPPIGHLISVISPKSTCV